MGSEMETSKTPEVDAVREQFGSFNASAFEMLASKLETERDLVRKDLREAMECLSLMERLVGRVEGLFRPYSYESLLWLQIKPRLEGLWQVPAVCQGVVRMGAEKSDAAQGVPTHGEGAGV